MPVTIGDSTGTAWSQATTTPMVSINPGASYGQDLLGDGPVVVAELTGAEADRRTIVLTARAKPYKPLMFGGQHRIESTEYDGYPQVSQQALGAMEMDSDWKGAWKTRFIGDTGTSGFDSMMTVHQSSTTQIDGTDAIGVSDTRVLNAAQAAELFDDIRRKGKVCRVSWLHLARV